MTQRSLLLSDIFPPKTGGSGRWFWEIYSRLPRSDFFIVAGEDPRAVEFDRTHDLRLVRWPLEMRTRGLKSFGNFKHYLKTARRLRKLVKQEGITAVHASRNLSEGFIAYLLKKFRGTPYLCFVHGEDVAISTTSRELAWMTRRVLKNAQLVIANSRNTQAMLLKEWNLPESKVRLLYPGVDTKRFVPAARDENIRAQFGWVGKQVVLTVGRLQKRKGQDHLIQAVKLLREQLPNLHYAIVGDGEEAKNLRELVQREGLQDRVQFLSEISDAQLMQCYQQCDLFALPNRAVGRDIEGFGMVLLEAQACGRPVLAGDSGGTAETMRIPETGCIVDCTKPEPLAAALAELFTKPARLDEMGRQGRMWVCERFDWEALAKEAQAVFATVGGK